MPPRIGGYKDVGWGAALGVAWRFVSFRFHFRIILAFVLAGVGPGASAAETIQVGDGWAANSVNTVVFRTSTMSHEDVQYTSYYDGEGYMILAKRQHGSSDWEVQRTQYQGNVRDAHNSISIGVDGSGVIHVAWDHHNHPLRYAKGVAPGSLELTEKLPMTGKHESAVTYPQFYRLPDGDLLFLYRDGASGSGDAMLNRYRVSTGKWEVVQHPLISGEGRRNPYLNTMAIDSRGGIHLSWVWRESPDVASNHDLCFAYSRNGGKEWVNSKNDAYDLPIVEKTAEVAWKVPQGHELINQTSMAAGPDNRPVIATYWREGGTKVPQYRIAWFDGRSWKSSQVTKRKEPFSLSGGGTKRIPISRPQVAVGKDGAVHVVFRDEERGGVVSVATSTDPQRWNWKITDLTETSVGAWEPTFDAIRWEQDGQLDLFVQKVGQGDGERTENIPPQPVSILEWKP